MNIAKTLQVSRLFGVYKNLLTKKQQEIVKAYVFYNGSLGEIAEEFGVSRQASFDLLKRTINKLFEYEEKLGICKKIDKICLSIQKTYQSSLTKNELKTIIETIKELEEWYGII